VLYTNVVEALLRFVLVDRGYMLLHSACMDIDGKGLMLSARTDTGKTGTVLKLLRLSEGKFLSDDMTIIDRSGVARSFPKPLTISQHTLRAVDAGDLSRTEWLWLRVQSRLHSKEGRGFALKMADMNMTINSWVQRIIPPPKYFVQRLVPCQLGTMTSVSDIYIIERGEPHRSAVNQSQAVIELLENTEDAYGFPPYRYLAPMFTVGGTSYDELRQRERLILISAMESIEITRLGSDNFTWAQDITETMRAEAAADAATAAVDEAAFGDLLIEQEGVVQVEND
jgi:dolichol-phosphate mannosyltransferase